MINWRNGKGGFVGGLKYAIKGVFQFAHSITSDTDVIAPFSTFGVSSLINTDGTSVRSNIGSTVAIESEISEDGLGARSNMDSTGLGLESGF